MSGTLFGCYTSFTHTTNTLLLSLRFSRLTCLSSAAQTPLFLGTASKVFLLVVFFFPLLSSRSHRAATPSFRVSAFFAATLAAHSVSWLSFVLALPCPPTLTLCVLRCLGKSPGRVVTRSAFQSTSPPPLANFERLGSPAALVRTPFVPTAAAMH